MASRSRSSLVTGPPKQASKRMRAAKPKRQQRLAMYPSLASNRLGGAFPSQKKCRMVYTDLVYISTTAGFGKFTFSANGIYDPNLTGVGGQPMYFDQLAALYNHYCVTSSFLEYQVMATNVNRDFITTIYIDDDATTDNSAIIAGQRPGAKTVSINPSVTVPPVVSLGWNAARNFGPGVLNNSLFRGDSVSNPSEQQYYCILLNDTALNSESVPVRIKMTFDVTWTEFTNVASS